MWNEGNQINNFKSGFGSGTVINYGSGLGFLTSSGSGFASQKVKVPTVPVPQHWPLPTTGNSGWVPTISRLFEWMELGLVKCQNVVWYRLEGYI